MAILRIACVLALVAAALAQIVIVPSPGGSGFCSGVTICLREGETDCNTRSYRNRECAAGLYCQLGTVLNTTTGEYVGTCRSASALGEACSQDPTNVISCYDPNYPDAITCDDPLSNGNGTCRYANIFYPGESCASDPNYVNGGCVYGSCTGGICDTVAAGTQCDNFFGERRCPFNQFCDQQGGGSSNLCVTRKASGADCNGNFECDQLLVCTSRGNLFDNDICAEPFVGQEGDLCDDEYDCSAGLLCDNRICVKPSPFKKDFCTSDTDCQTGWNCECLFDDQGHKVVFTGGKCTEKTSVTSEQINRWRKYQQCTKDRQCVADFHYLEEFSNGNSAILNNPDSCVYTCLREAGYEIEYTPEGQCISSAAAIFPIVAVIFAAVFAVLF